MLLAPPLLVTGCGGGGSGGGGGAPATAAGVSSGTPGSTTGGVTSSSTITQVGPLYRKAIDFEKVMQAQHLPLGQVQDVIVDPATGAVTHNGGSPSRLLWTGFYSASQAMRYRATQNPDALANMEAGLRTLRDLYDVNGSHGAISRGYDIPSIETNGFPASGRFAGFNYNKGTPSRDQYAGWFYGIGHGFDHIQDPALKQELSAQVTAVCEVLMQNDLQMSAMWGTGQVEPFFNLRPDYFYQNRINAQTWAKVDDFPINLITKSVPYDPALAAAIASASIPPVRAGEALKAIFFFTVAEHVTKDPRFGDYKRQLLWQRGYADVLEKYLTFQDDLFNGRNLKVAEDALKQVFQTLGTIVQAYLVAKGTNSLVTQLLIPITTAGVSGWLSDLIVDVIAWIHDPSNQAKLNTWVQRLQFGTTILALVGQQNLANKINGFMTTYGRNLNHQGLIDLANTIRSHLGVNLNLMPLSLMIRLETDPRALDLYKRSIERYAEDLKQDHNPIVNLIHLAHGTIPRATDLPQTLETLRRFPTDMRMRQVDNSNYPGLVVSTWPDRFGRVGDHAIYPLYFEIDERGPDIFPWRGHPRQIKTGHPAAAPGSPSSVVAPLGYLSPYWLARDMGVIDASD
ncbi:MAG: hypothetical protein JKY65_22760 [Planctomycetes bacterium]|nr:hypothetical protein [Planctomycetota bacterium]